MNYSKSIRNHPSFQPLIKQHGNQMATIHDSPHQCELDTGNLAGVAIFLSNFYATIYQ
jgi:hypothetical protein